MLDQLHMNVGGKARVLARYADGSSAYSDSNYRKYTRYRYKSHLSEQQKHHFHVLSSTPAAPSSSTPLAFTVEITAPAVVVPSSTMAVSSTAPITTTGGHPQPQPQPPPHQHQHLP